MGRLGIGCSIARRRPQAVSAFEPASIMRLTPSEQWDGTAGSGFTALPLDPVRTIAKPACRLIVPPNQRFTDRLTMGVMAMANNSGSMFENFGLSHVRVHFEGATLDIAAPSQRTLTDANGIERKYVGWWVELTKPANSEGVAHLYFEAVPTNTSMQSRVIGPYSVFPSASLFDGELELAAGAIEVPGAVYNNWRSAASHIKAMAWDSARITVTEPGEYDIRTVAGGYDPASWIVTEASTPGVIFKNMSGFVNDNSRMRPRVANLCWRGSNLTIDFDESVTYFVENGEYVWLDGCNVTNRSAAGKEQLFRGGPPNVPQRFREGTWFTEAICSQLHNPAHDAELVRGGTWTDTSADVFSEAKCVVFTQCHDHETYFFNTDRDALTVEYVGAASSATLESQDIGNHRMFTARVDGFVEGTFTVGFEDEDWLGIATDTDGYLVSDVVNWLNTLPNWSATLLDDTFRGGQISLPGEKATEFAPVDVKQAPVTFITVFDLHADWYQKRINSDSENVILAFNTVINIAAQNIFTSPSGEGIRDFFVVGNAFYNRLDDTPNTASSQQKSQIGEADFSHYVWAHNTMASQEIVLDADNAIFDQHCLIANNAVNAIRWRDDVPDTALTISNNHIVEGETAPPGSFGTSIGGNPTTLFADAPNGDFTPQGALLNAQTPATTAYDLTGKARGSMSTPGAVTPQPQPG
ncbi:MAG: hypothetical protein AAGK02_02410 [Pseudomonadota bacterium]